MFNDDMEICFKVLFPLAKKTSFQILISSVEQHFRCHCLVLALYSVMFKTMFENKNFCENIEPRNILLNDIYGGCLKNCNAVSIWKIVAS